MTPAALRRTYVAAICSLGLVVLAVVLPRLATTTITRWPELTVLVVLLVISEQFPVRIDTRNGQDLITLSGAFCCALLLHWDLSIAVAAQCAAALINDVAHRVRWYKAAFNVAQFALSVTAAGLVVHLFHGDLGERHLDSATVVVSLLAGTVFFLVNDVLTGVALALEDGAPVGRSLVADLPFQVALNGAGIALTPLLIAAADDTLLLIPLPAAAAVGGALQRPRAHRPGPPGARGPAHRSAEPDPVPPRPARQPRDGGERPRTRRRAVPRREELLRGQRHPRPRRR